MDKAGKLSISIKGCENAQNDAINKYIFKLKDCAIQAENAIKETNIGNFSSGSSSLSQEEVKNGEKVKESSLKHSNLHEQYAKNLMLLYLAKDKAMNSYKNIAEEIQKQIV